MFNEPKIHEKEITAGQYKIRMGGRVPPNAANLAYAYTQPLVPSENVQIADASGFILENSSYGKEEDLKMWPDETFRLRNLEGKSDIYSQSFLITHISKDGSPLYYRHRLKNLHYDSKGPDSSGFYQGKSITVLDGNGNKIDGRGNYLCKMYPSPKQDFYYVDVFTDFTIKPGEEYRVYYNALDVNPNGEETLVPGYKERMNPQPAFEPQRALTDVASDQFADEMIYYKGDSAEFGYSRIYVSNRPVQDNRKPITFTWRIIARVNTSPNSNVELISPWFDAQVLNPDSLTNDDTEYSYGFKKLSPYSLEELMKKFYVNRAEETWFDIYDTTYTVETNEVDVEIDAKADGNEPPVAKGLRDTGVLNVPADFYSYATYPPVGFKVQCWFTHVRTGAKHLALDTREFFIRKTDGLAPIKSIQYAELQYPAGYNENDYALSVELSNSKAPVSILVWDKNAQSYINADSIPGFLLTQNGQFIIEAQTQYESKGFSPTYYVRPLDGKQIQVQSPIAKENTENWFLRIQNGQFYRTLMDSNNLPIGYGYFVPEYFNQSFSDEMGIPVRRIEGERPEVIGDNLIKVKYAPLYLKVDRGTQEVLNITVKVNGIKYPIFSWDSAAGIIELDGFVRDSDDITVDYDYEEYCYEYRGFWDEDRKKFWYLDLNPGKGHYYTSYDADSDMLLDEPSFKLINKTVYIYIKPTGDMTNIQSTIGERIELDTNNVHTLASPALRILKPRVYLVGGTNDVPYIDDAVNLSAPYWEYTSNNYLFESIRIHNLPTLPTGSYYAIDYSYISDKYRFLAGTFNNKAIYHTFEEVTDDPNSLLLAKIQVRPNSTINNLNLIDTRTRGGGLEESIGQSVINEVLPEGNSYFDIGHWDGKPYQENAVIVIKLPRHILKEYGGRLTKEDVENGINKHIGYGVFYIVEYLEESTSLIEVPQDLRAEVVELPDIKARVLNPPEFILITE